MVYQAVRVSGLGSRLMRFTAPVLMAAATSLLACGRQYNSMSVKGNNWDDVTKEACEKAGVGAGKATTAGLESAKKQLVAINDNAQAPGANIFYPNGLEVICTTAVAAAAPTSSTATTPQVVDLGSAEVEIGQTMNIDITNRKFSVGAISSVAANIKADPKINAELVVSGGKATTIKATPKLTAKADEIYTLYLMNGNNEIAFVTIKIKGRSGGNGPADAGVVVSDAGPAKSKGVCAGRVDDIKLNECNAKCGAEAAAADKED
ncbi:MAG: hypothetical protein WC624_04615, partial [Candidatus Margulisiibacteriota bacterium]